MDKLKLITWMGYIEAAFVEITHGHRPQETLARATDARMDFTADANCASIKDPTDTPPPSAWPSVSRIRKETRAEVVAELVNYLRQLANECEKSVLMPEHQQMVYWYRRAAEDLAARFN